MTRAEPEQKPDGSFEDAFSKELARRGMGSMDGDAKPETKGPSAGAPSSSSNTGGSGAAPGTNPFAAGAGSGANTRTRSRAPPPPMAPRVEDDQRQRSMDLVTEGLEGLFPRAKVLLQLGGGLFLAFLPFMLIFSALFTGIFYVWGDSFLHGGRATGPPQYIDPQRLLSEPTVDPYIPFNSSPYSAPDLR